MTDISDIANPNVNPNVNMNVNPSGSSYPTGMNSLPNQAGVTYGKASAADYDELIDFANLVFSQAHSNTDFTELLPKLYKRNRFVPESHYIVKENGRIKALVGAYPIIYNVCGEPLKVFSIGIVCVHPYTRSKGYMKLLMNEAMRDMKAAGMDLGELGGLRQRYEYFGFTKCGTELTFTCNETNFRHRFHGTYPSGLSFAEIAPGDRATLDAVAGMYARKPAHAERHADMLHDILISWKGKAYAIMRSGEMIGYMSAQLNRGVIQEIYMPDASLLVEALGVFISQFKIKDLHVVLPPYEAELARRLVGFAEETEIETDGNFNALNYPNVLRAFVKLKCAALSESFAPALPDGCTPALPDGCSQAMPDICAPALPDGKLTVRILAANADGADCNVTISVSGGKVDVRETGETPDYTFSHLEAMQFFFNPLSAHAYGPLASDAFTRALLPLPLNIDHNDTA